ncbi:hypothetical protein M408DRAFT_329211 [Serendipita vermifera MAFF 305830]|uniref:OTU domain-containing protein n=1 Tax=Serendipita vermifera MAFF 305830 TaxID=933852 RepID=A0A0C3B9H0_SERVB|nr:hypothetical protein M408DRAFT_329211 [Serendipita vermifera MAFF 305830]
MFKKKNKKSPAPVAPLPVTSDDLEDDLFAQLDAKDQSALPAPVNATPQSSTTLATTTSTESSQSTKLQKPKKDSKLRFKAREARKALKLNAFSKPSDPSADAKLEQEARNEERDIKRICDQLGLDMYEIQPDGHCLFAAVADQLALHGLISRATASYAATRLAAANYMLAHQDDFLPFLPSIEGEDGANATDDGMMTPKQFSRYCATIRDTAAWGGEPEILALSRAFNVPIHVVQAGKPPVVIHEPVDGMSDVPGTKVVFISYHRRMYGLGEHYNSLRPTRMRVQPTVEFISVMH